MAYLVSCPIAYNAGAVNMRGFQELYWQLAVMGLIVLFCNNIWLVAFFWYNILLLALNGGEIGAPYVQNIFLGIMLFSVMRRYFKYFRAEIELKPIAWLVILTSFWMLLQLLRIDPLFNPAPNPTTDGPLGPVDFVGVFGLKAINAMFLAIALPFIACINVFIAPLLFIPMYLSQSGAAIAAGAVGYLFYLFFMHKKLFKIMTPIILIAAIGFVLAKDFKDAPHMYTARFGIWHAGVKYGMQRPMGYGPDSWRNITKHKDFIFMGGQDQKPAIAFHIEGDNYQFNYYSPDSSQTIPTEERPPMVNHWDNAHNEYIQLFFEYGFLGLFLLGGLVREIYTRFRFAIKSKELVFLTATLVVIMVVSLGQFPFHLARIGFLIPVLMGAFYSLTDGDKKRRLT